MGWYFIEGYYKDWVGYMWGFVFTREYRNGYRIVRVWCGVKV